MVFFAIILLFLILYKSKINIKDFYYDYLSKDKTSFVKGIFVILVFYRHCSTYTSLNHIIDKPIICIDAFLSQSIVSMFLFYSGYGIYEQIKVKEKYIKTFFKRRFLPILFDFAIAIISFLIINIFIKKITNYSLKTILLSFIGWDSIGNSNWYMFVTFLIYLFVIIAFNIYKRNYNKSIFCIILFTFIYSVIIIKIKPQHWMNTSFCFPLGMLFSYYKKDIEKKIMNNKNYVLAGLFLIISYLALNIIYFKTLNPYIFVFVSCIFSLIIVMLTMKISINNNIFKMLGNNIFWIYILQRIPMIVLSYYGFQKYSYLFFVACFIITIIISCLYKYIFDEKIMSKYILHKEVIK